MIKHMSFSGQGLRIDDLIALNDEIAALARAGMPLERGLMGVGGDLPGRLGKIATELGKRMERGQSLPEALASEGAGVPATYRAVVEAGMRSGRLAEALQGLAGFARSYVELRRAIGLALLYPVLVLLLGYGLFVLFVLELIPRLHGAFDALRVPFQGPVVALERMGGSVAIWGPVLPLMVFIGWLLWVATGRASAFQPGKIGRGLRWVPWMGSILDGATAAQFADWLALLVEHDVPWADAVTLAADATGDGRLSAAARRMAEESRRGQPTSSTVRRAGGFPPLLLWLMGVGRRQDTLVQALRHAADTYRRRSFRKAAMLRVTLPSILLILIGATTTLVYSLTLFLPWTTLLNGLTRFK
ncbi:MAG: type secretory pathway, component PulF [Planctomycetota bacterium]|nr:type secretory pathway, component PulF [Planctomycetota bacterium]